MVVGNLGNYGRIVWLICLYLCAVSGGEAVSRGRYLLGRTNNVGDPRSRTCEQATAGTTSLSTYTSTSSFTDSQTSATASYCVCMSPALDNPQCRSVGSSLPPHGVYASVAPDSSLFILFRGLASPCPHCICMSPA